jgi:hypothetical protein
MNEQINVLQTFESVEQRIILVVSHKIFVVDTIYISYFPASILLSLSERTPLSVELQYIAPARMAGISGLEDLNGYMPAIDRGQTIEFE